MTVRGWCFATALPLALACSHAQKKEAAAAAPPPPAAAAQPVAAAPTPPPAPEVTAPTSCFSDDQCGAKELCAGLRCVAITPGLAQCQASAHFDFDRAVLHDADLPSLRRAARCLSAVPDEHALIEGSCDDRGTAQYNIALGFRRAHAAARYLEALGIQDARVEEVSYGKELPLCTASTEACWAMNRRADVLKGAEPKDVTARLRADERREKKETSEGSTAPAKAASHGRHPGNARASGTTDAK